MIQHPPSTIVEFLERAGVLFGWTPRGKLVFLLTAETRALQPVIQASLPVIERDLAAREALRRKTNGARGPAPAIGPRLNSLRVTHLFRGINQVEAFVGEAQWVEVCWVKRARDGRKVGARELSKLLSAGTEPAGEKGNSSSKD